MVLRQPRQFKSPQPLHILRGSLAFTTPLADTARSSPSCQMCLTKGDRHNPPGLKGRLSRASRMVMDLLCSAAAAGNSSASPRCSVRRHTRICQGLAQLPHPAYNKACSCPQHRHGAVAPIPNPPPNNTTHRLLAELEREQPMRYRLPIALSGAVRGQHIDLALHVQPARITHAGRWPLGTPPPLPAGSFRFWFVSDLEITFIHNLRN